MVDYNEFIVRDPEICGGLPVINLIGLPVINLIY